MVEGVNLLVHGEGIVVEPFFVYLDWSDFHSHIEGELSLVGAVAFGENVDSLVELPKSYFLEIFSDTELIDVGFVGEEGLV